MSGTHALIELNRVCFSYEGQIALRYVTFSVRPGETVVLEGPNGSGKTTLLRLLNGILFAEEGTYTFAGHRIDRKAMRDGKFSKWFHQKVGFIFQDSDVQLFCPDVEDEIAFGPRQMGLSDEEVRRRTEDVIRLLGLDALRDRAPYHLSGGEKKKVAFASVLSMNPEVFVFDEPLAGLDRATQERLTSFLLDLKKTGKTIILATHNETLGNLLGDRHIVFNELHEATEKDS